MGKMTAVQVGRPGGGFEVVTKDVPEPGPGQVRLKVQACGICHSDAFVKDGHWPGLQYPRVTGHEVAGVIDAVGPGVTGWQTGQRAGAGWHGGHCGACAPCRRGDFIACRNLQVTGFHFDGGYGQYMIARSDTLAAIPDALSPAEAAPILCAGITTFNSLRHSGAKPGDLVAVQGIGGLGHLGIQFASGWASRRSRSAGARTRRLWPRSSAPTSISIPPRSMRRRSWPRWAAPPSSWPRRQTARPCRSSWTAWG